jgi:hypothetical protein
MRGDTPPFLFKSCLIKHRDSFTALSAPQSTWRSIMNWKRQARKRSCSDLMYYPRTRSVSDEGIGDLPPEL